VDWLVDVGFGARSHCPPAIGRRREREDLGGTFLIIEAGQDSARGGGADPGSGDLDVVRDGGRVYRLELRSRAPGDVVAGAR
jgi:N-hydroxyarylamine O-acetyltransferase